MDIRRLKASPYAAQNGGLPYAPEAWIDEKKTKKGYEIPMTRYFYEYQAPEPVGKIAVRLHELELDIQSSLEALFGEK